jgi:hypothetical protein
LEHYAWQKENRSSTPVDGIVLLFDMDRTERNLLWKGFWILFPVVLFGAVVEGVFAKKDACRIEER